MAAPEGKGDPRVYMAAERTFLAWMRTGLALMGFGFLVARFGLFLRALALPHPDGTPPAIAPPLTTGFSIYLGVALVGLGILVQVVAAVRHHRYVCAIDQGRFREAFGSSFAFAIAAFLAVVGVAMAVYLFEI
jgi:putative membrane protein